MFDGKIIVRLARGESERDSRTAKLNIHVYEAGSSSDTIRVMCPPQAAMGTFEVRRAELSIAETGDAGDRA